MAQKKQTMKANLILFIALFILSNNTFSQIPGRAFTNSISDKEIYNKVSGERINENDLSDLIENNPHIYFEPVINKYGDIESYLVDPSAPSNNGRIISRDVSRQVKKGGQFPPFVMKSIKNRVIDSEKIRGKIILMQFQLQLVKPFFRKQTFDAFNSLIEDIRKTTEVEAVIVTESTTNEIKEQIGDCNYVAEMIPNGRNFNQKYQVVNFPSIVLIDKNGCLVSYYNQVEIEIIKSDIEKIKNESPF